MNECIQLSPFFHQVGGHSSMLQYDQNTVCKVLDVDELKFYETMPDALKSFTPEYRGIITAKYFEDKLDSKILTRNQIESSINDDSSSTDINLAKRTVQLRCSEDGQIDYSNGLGKDLTTYEQGKITVSQINPWSLQLCKKHTEKLHRQFIGDENVPVSQQFILLENVTAKFVFPCILDLKMGKRQYADIDSDKKRQSKIEKCQLSTSSTLGVRLCGMQVYQVEENRYIFTDKYRGRILSVDDFRSSLKEFINNGRENRFEILPSIIERLESLHETISSMGNYRFYSGSLLIVYDGLTSSDRIDLRMIDFAHSMIISNENDENRFDPDRDYLFGLKHLIEMFREIFNNQRSDSK